MFIMQSNKVTVSAIGKLIIAVLMSVEVRPNSPWISNLRFLTSIAFNQANDN